MPFINVSRRASLEDIDDEEDIEEYESEDNTDIEKKVKRLIERYSKGYLSSSPLQHAPSF